MNGKINLKSFFIRIGFIGMGILGISNENI